MEKVNASVHKTEPLFPLSSGLGIHVNRPYLCILQNYKHASYSCHDAFHTQTNQCHRLKQKKTKVPPVKRFTIM